jgi:hypothetical protein
MAVLAVVCVVLLMSMTFAVVAMNDANKRSENDRKDVKELSDRLLMNYPMLAQAQSNVQEGIVALATLMTGKLAPELGTTGLNSTAARTLLTATLADSPYIIDLIALSSTGIVVAVEPDIYDFMEGMDFTDDEDTRSFLANKTPFMSNVFLGLEGMYGSSIGAPVFDLDGKFIGGICAYVNVSALIHDSVSFAEDMGVTFSAIQIDGLDIGGSDPLESGLNLFTSHEYDAFPELRNATMRMANETFGYAEYSYKINISATTVVHKEMFWTSIGWHGSEWRLAIIRTL